MAIPITGAPTYPTASAFGAIARAGSAPVRAYSPVGGPSGPIYRISIAGAENSETYSARIIGTFYGQQVFDETESVETDASATQTELRDLLDAAIKGNNTIAQALDVEDPTDPGTNLLDINTAPGWELTITFPANPTTDLSVAVQSAAVARPEFLYGYVYRRVSLATAIDGIRREGIQAITEISGPEITIALTYAGSQTGQWAVTYRDATGDVKILSDDSIATGANLAAFLAAFEASVDGEFGGDITVTATSPNVVISMPVGYEVISFSASASGGAAAAATLDTGDDAPDFVLVTADARTAPVGRNDGQPSTVTGPIPTQSPQGMRPGIGDTQVTVPYTESVTQGDLVFVETAAANRGKVYATPTPTCAPWHGATFAGVDPQASTVSALIAL